MCIVTCCIFMLSNEICIISIELGFTYKHSYNIWLYMRFSAECLGNYSWRWSWYSSLSSDKEEGKTCVPLGANYRLIDIPVSNCLNSNISKIYVLTQFNSASLNCHLSRAYASSLSSYKNEGLVEVLAAQQSPENPNWFQVYICQTWHLIYLLQLW